MPDVKLAKPEQDPCDRQGDFNHGGEAYLRELKALRRPLSAEDLIDRWRRLPVIDPAALRQGIDSQLPGSCGSSESISSAVES